ncbi:unnamed protein product [Pleuronectes platessa]|uniref:Uncharacterized protein n=1 Tax=Pleuronectes platessa TaxID=8262 RepID=A0A9N7YQ32_PLEPL|nr:unnamed protein product [Pleuronectes platessa]
MRGSQSPTRDEEVERIGYPQGILEPAGLWGSLPLMGDHRRGIPTPESQRVQHGTGGILVCTSTQEAETEWYHTHQSLGSAGGAGRQASLPQNGCTVPDL